MASHDQIVDIFKSMMDNFDSDKAQGINATVQFDFSADGGGQYWLRIADDGVQTGEGPVENPKMTLRATSEDFTSMINGSLNPMQAFMTGKIKIQGDTGLALKLMPLING